MAGLIVTDNPDSWKFDKEAILDVACDFGIEFPLGPYRGLPEWCPRTTAGVHQMVEVGFSDCVHLIYILPYLTAESASMTLYHELTHAAQAEGYASPQEFKKAYMRQAADLGMTEEMIHGEVDRDMEKIYRQIPLEAEAYENEKLHYERPLTVLA